MKTYFMFVGMTLLSLLIFGGVVPALISSTTYIGPIIALGIIVVYFPVLFYLIKQIFKSTKEKVNENV